MVENAGGFKDPKINDSFIEKPLSEQSEMLSGDSDIIDKERQTGLLKNYGVTEANLEKAADEFLRKYDSPDNDSSDLALDIFTPRTGVEIYKQTPDPDQKVAILNTHLVKTDETGLFATSQTIRDLSFLIHQHTEQGLEQFRSDEVSGLSHNNLMVVANTLTGEQEEDENQLNQALELIQHLSQDENADNGQDEISRRFADEIFGEMLDRLEDTTMDPLERAEFIDAVESSLTPGLLKKIARERSDVLSALSASAQEFTNPSLRDVLTKELRKPLEGIQEVVEVQAPEDLLIG